MYFSFIWGTILLVFIFALIRLIANGFHIVSDFVALSIILFLLWTWFGTGYRIEKEIIKVQSGPLRQSIHIQDIHKINKERSLLSAPSLAMDRLVLHYGNYEFVHLTPEREEAFIETLLEINPGIQFNGEGSEVKKGQS